MLPEKLSTDLTSLADRQERPAVVVEITVGADGSIAGSDVYRAVVTNHAKLAYDAWRRGWRGTARCRRRSPRSPASTANLRMQDEVAQQLRESRHEHGALDLQTIEARPVFDGDELTDLRPEERNRAKELIEDFMIAANGVTARFLAAKELAVAAPRRAHAQALGPHRGAGGGTSARRCPRNPTRGRWPSSSPGGAPPTRCASPTSRSR